MAGLAATTSPLSSALSREAKSETKPPASRIRITPAAMSHTLSPRSQKPSKRPAATGKVERRGAVAAHAGADGHDRGKLLQEGRVLVTVAAPEERDAGGEQRVGHAAPAGDAKAAFVQERAPALFGEEELVLHRIEDCLLYTSPSPRDTA